MNYYLQRVGQTILTIFVVVSVTFGLLRAVPGGPIAQLQARLLRQPGLTPSDVERLVTLYSNINPQQPLLAAYVDYMVSIFQGDLGYSLTYNRSVLSILADSLPWTVFYASIALLLMFGISILLGALLAFIEGTTTDLTISSVVTWLYSIPSYIAALVLVFLLGYRLSWFPTSGRIGDVDQFGVDFVFSAVNHAILPIAAFVITNIGLALTMRGNSIQVIGSDYLRVADLRGLSGSHITRKYVIPNAVLPMYTTMMISIGFLFGGSAIIEQIFSYHGIGYYLIDAISNRDTTLLMGAFLVITIAVSLGTLFADLTYGLIDPRAGRDQNENNDSVSVSRILIGLKRYIKNSLSRKNRDQSGVGNEAATSLGSISGVNERATGSTRETTRARIRAVLNNWFIVPIKILSEDIRAIVGGGIVLIFVFAGVVGPHLIDSPSPIGNPSFVPPFTDMSYILGTGGNGRGLLAMAIYNTTPILKMVLAGTVFTSVLAITLGLLSGYLGGIVDRVASTIIDIMVAIPGLPLVIVVAAIFQPESAYLVGIVLSVNAWAGLARSIRSQMLVLKDNSYIEASRIMGVPTPSILVSDALPNLMPYILVNLVSSARNIIFTAVGLYYLGVLPISQSNWGIMMRNATQSYALSFPSRFYTLIVPMLCVILFSYGLVLLSQSADKLFNPRLRAQHQD